MLPIAIKKHSFSEYVVPYVLSILAIAEFFGMDIVKWALQFTGIGT